MEATRKRRWWLWILTLPAGLALLMLLLILTNPAQTFMANYALEKINSEISGKLSLDKAVFGISGKIQLENVSLKDAGQTEIAAAKLLSVYFDPLALFEDSIHIQLLRLDSLKLQLSFDSTGKSNLEAALKPRRQSAESENSVKQFDWTILLDSLEIAGRETRILSNNQTLFSSNRWSVNATGKYRQDSLFYALKTSSPGQFDFESEGELLFDKVNLSGVCDFQAGIGKSFTAKLAKPADKLGDMAIQGSLKLQSDSVFLKSEISSSEAGTINSILHFALPVESAAGSGNLVFDQFKPNVFWDDSISVVLNGNLDFVKIKSADYLNGWDIRFDFAHSNYSNYGIESARGVLTSADSAANLKADFVHKHGKAEINATVRGFDLKTMRIDADAMFSELALPIFVPQIPDSLSPLSGTLSVSAKHFTLSELQASAVLRLNNFSFGRYAADNLAVKASLDRKQFQIDTTLLVHEKDSLLFFANGKLGDSLRYKVSLKMPDLAELSVLIPQYISHQDSLSGSLNLSLTGTASLAGDSLSALTATGEVELKKAHFQRSSLDALNAKLFEYQSGSNSFFAGIKAVGIDGYGQKIDSVFIAVSGTPNDLSSDFSLWAKSDTIFIYSESRTKLNSNSINIELNKLLARTYGTEWKVEEPVNVTLGKNKVEVDALRIFSPLGVLRGTGYIQRGGEQDLALEISGLQTEELAKILKKNIPASSVNLRLLLQGPDTALVGDVFVTADSVKLKDKELADEFYIHASVTKELSVLDGYSIWFKDTLFTLAGTLPLQLTYNNIVLHDDLPISGNLRVLNQPLEKLNPYLPYGCKTSGDFQGTFLFSGTPKHPLWSGNFALQNGTFYDPRNGVDYKKGFINGSLREDSLFIDHFDAEAGGTLTGRGKAVMEFPLPKNLDLDMSFKQFQVVRSKQMGATASGRINIIGSVDSLSALGQITLDETNYRVTQATTKSVEDIDLEGILAELHGDTIKPEGFFVKRFYKSMSHDLVLDIPRNCWIRGGGMNVELSGKLYLDKESGKAPDINGQIDVNSDRSTIQFYGRELKVTGGYVRYDGPLDNPEIDFNATEPRLNEQYGIDINVRLFGTLAESQFEMSDKTGKLTPEQLVLLLTFGVFPDSSGGIQAENLQQRASSTAAGQLSGLVGKAAGLDLFEYKPGESGLGGGTLEVGTYVTSRLFVKVKQPVETSQSGRELNAEYQLFKWLKVAGKQAGTGEGEMKFIFQVEWR